MTLCDYAFLHCQYDCVFFFKHKTAYEMRISDWSSDVCSSDLLTVDSGVGLNAVEQLGLHDGGVDLRQVHRLVDVVLELCRVDAVVARLRQIEAGTAGRAQLGDHLLVVGAGYLDEIGRASCRERVCQYV